MKKAWDAVAAYAAANAENPRKGYKLGELTTDEVLAYAACEMFELARAPDDVSELADLLGCLFHYAQRKGWSRGMIERELIRKLALRFPGTGLKLAFAGKEEVVPTEEVGDTQGYTHGYTPEDSVETVESLAEYDRRMAGKIQCSICRDPNCDNPGGKH